MYIADYNNHRIRKVTVSTGIITTIAGSGGTGSYSGDDGQATSASFNLPRGVAVDETGTAIYMDFFLLIYFLFYLGNVYIADFYNHRIRKVTVATGIVSTFAGTGTSSFSGDNGPATAATLSYPPAVALDASGTHIISHIFLT